MNHYWQPLGRCLADIPRQGDWMVTHACVPTAIYLPASDRIRVYFAPRNTRGQSIPTYLEVAAARPTERLYLHDRPVLELGELGTFDDGGIMPCSLTIGPQGEWLLYYVGWNPSVSVGYRNAVGLAVSRDEGKTFERAFPGAVVDRTRFEPFFTASPGVIRFSEGDYRMYYASSTGFVRIDGRVEPLYEIKLALSEDGYTWQRPNRTCIPPSDPLECTARPTIVRDADRLRMWYCYRGSHDYRGGAGSYRIGYAESTDGLDWKRLDNNAAAAPARDDWDRNMQTYPSVVETPHGRYLFYNGNGFGATGIGVARWTEHD